jgi:hypothetical protein
MTRIDGSIALVTGGQRGLLLAGVEEGRTEVLVDSASEHFKAALAGPVEGLTLPLPF